MGRKNRCCRWSAWARCSGSTRRWRGGTGITICGDCPNVPQRQLQASVLGMIITADAEGDIDGIPGQKLELFEPLGHVPAESIEHDFASQPRRGFGVLRARRAI